MRKGRFRKARLKWIRKNVYNFRFSESVTYGSHSYKQRHDGGGEMEYLGERPDWYLDMIKISSFEERFLFCYNLRLRDKFYFSMTLKRNVTYRC